jgi:organic hydroperoxide reductase OsmC/OhrA
MSEHRATIAWQRNGPNFLKGHFSREHTWAFDGGVTVLASPSPTVIPKPWSNPEGVDPEEAFVASIASCHMLTFLWLASRQGFEVERYDDEAVGVLTKNEQRVSWVSAVTLYPRIVYGGEKRPTRDDEASLHHAAHAQCFIANSVKTAITVAGFESEGGHHGDA